MKLVRIGALAALLWTAGGCREPQPANMTADEVAAELAELRIEPGQWEISSDVLDVRAPNLPLQVRSRMVGPRSRMRHCITAEQAERPSANFLAMRSDSACAYRDFVFEGGRLHGTMACPGVTARMNGNYGPRGYETRMEMQSPLPDGATMTLQIRTRGRRVGPCEGADPS
ncbi:MAG TPA: DUF3617 domain-containing protein [Allosphingosinicella sp.]|nr:DUF3617 domain-containing protein [Allosphingosinicella sp.]